MTPKRVLWIAIAVIAALVLAGIAYAVWGGGEAEPDDGETPQAEEPDTEEPTTTPPADGEGDGEGDGSGSDEAPAGEDVTLKIYFSYAGEAALAIERTVPYTQAVATAAMNELLAGPTDAELATWPVLSTQIPEGTELLGLTVSDGVAQVNLSGEFDDGGGTYSMTARLAQVVYTLAQFPTVDAVEFYIEGVAVDVFSGEGIILDGPQAPEDYYDLVPIDA